MTDSCTLPDFPDFRDLTLEDRSILHPLFQELQPEISDRCFTNLFMWQPFYNIRLSRLNGNIILFASSSSTPEKQFFFPPVGSREVMETIQDCMDYLKEIGAEPIIRRAPEDFVTVNEEGLRAFDVQGDEDISDYIYRAEDLITLKGRRYNGQRNFISRFKKRFDYTIEEINPSNADECIQFCNWWLDEKLQAFQKRNMPETASVFLRAEVQATNKILQHFKVLKLTGMLVRIQGKAAGITIGELLNREMAVIHVEKCDHSYLGLSQFINQEFCRRFWSGCRFVNRMEDLGIPSLRKAKIALGPHHMARKFNILPKRP